MDISKAKFQYVDKDGKTVEETLLWVVGADGAWTSGKLQIMSYNACKRLFEVARLKYVAPPSFVCEPTEGNKQQHIWLMGMEDSFGKVTYSDGEASRFNTGKLVAQKQADWTVKTIYSELTEIDAKYRSRMAFKRAFCRCVLDLIGFEDFYSAEDAREFAKMPTTDIDSSTIEAL